MFVKFVRLFLQNANSDGGDEVVRAGNNGGSEAVRAQVQKRTRCKYIEIALILNMVIFKAIPLMG